MRIGGSVFLIALGAILTFAVTYQVTGVDINIVGIILMIAGAIGLVAELAVWGPRRRRSATVVEDEPGTVEERRVYDDRRRR